MTRTMLCILLAMLVALSFGCSKKKEPVKTEKKSEVEEKAGKISPTFDPVSKEEIDITNAPYSYELDGVIYYFSSEKNMEAFKADPQKYVAEITGGTE